MSYDEINKLLNTYNKKHKGEIWSESSESKNQKMINIKAKIRLFEGINGEYFKLIGSQKQRAIFLIKKFNFNKICPICSDEQIIVMICYFVKCEYIPRYRREWCKTVFNDYKISTHLLDRFLLYLANYNIKETELKNSLT